MERTDFGGCGPHYANGLVNMGIGCTCVGAMGYPEKNSVFNLNPNCKTISISEPGYSYLFEFGDGKFIMSDIEKISQLRWSDLIERISVDKLVEIFDDADIITLVNWSYLVHFHEIYEKFLETVMPRLKKRDRKIYIDIADCAKRQPEEIKAGLKMFGRYSEYAPTYLGLNKSEAMVMHSILCDGEYNGSLPTARAIKEFSGINTVVIHPVDSSAAVYDGGEIEVAGILCENPKKTTGGGDNFNIRTASGVIKAKINDIYEETLSHDERTRLANLIYYPEKTLKISSKDNEWYKENLLRLIEVCKVVCGKYTHSKVRKALPEKYAYIIDELLNCESKTSTKKAIITKL